jgi:hypothetical protein
MGFSQIAGVREYNRQQILWHILNLGACSRAALVEQTGLSGVTVTSITTELCAERYLTEIRKTEGSTGRPAGIFDFHPGLGTLVGIDCQPGEVCVLTSDVRGNRPQKRVYPVDSRRELSATLLSALDTVFTALPHGPVQHVTVSFPAPVSSCGEVQEPNSLPELDLRTCEQKVLAAGADWVVENDANLRALAEKHHGAAVTEDNFMVLVQRRSGVGLGLYLGGAMYRGSTGLAGELSLAQWPSGGKPTQIEHLPLSARKDALVYLLGGIAVSLDVRLLVVTRDSQADFSDFGLEIQSLSSRLRVVPSPLGAEGSALGALTASRLRYAQSVLEATASPAVRPAGVLVGLNS